MNTKLTCAPQAASKTHNLLVVSDLHLGEALIEPSVTGKAHLERVSAAFSRFLEYYAARPVGGRPWRLIVAGDMIDFVRARLVAGLPHDRRPGGQWGSAALDHIVALHSDPFVDLAAFLAAGHEVVVLRGNHDADLHWDEVQTRLVEHLVAFAPCDPEGVRARVQFSRWFWHEAELLYVEHGNQYDKFCSFEHVLDPTLGGQSELEDPIAHQTFRAFARQIAPTCDLHAIDHWKLPDFARWLAGLGPRLIGRLFVTYLGSVRWMLATRRCLLRMAQETHERHAARLGDLAARVGLDHQVVQRLHALRERPAGLRLYHGLRMLYLDHLVAIAVALFVVLAVQLSPLEEATRGELTTAVGGAALLVMGCLLALRDVSPVPKLSRAARRIREVLPVRYVVFGHSHVPTAERLGHSSVYYNTGSWTGDSGGGLTHLCILRDEPRAELRRWCTTREAPVSAEGAW